MLIEEFIPMGRENAISRRDLVTRVGLPDRKVRRAIAAAQDRGVVILNLSDGEGYFRPTRNDRECLRAYILQERARAMSILKRARLSRALLEDYDRGAIT